MSKDMTLGILQEKVIVAYNKISQALREEEIPMFLWPLILDYLSMDVKMNAIDKDGKVNAYAKDKVKPSD